MDKIPYEEFLRKKMNIDNLEEEKAA